jgi:hypothetical protein
MRRLLVRYGLAMSSVVLVAFLVPLGLLARSQAQDAALDAAREDAQGVAVFAGGATGDPSLLEATVLAANEGPRRTTVYLPDGSVVGAAAERSPAVELAALGQALVARTPGGAEVVLPVGGAAGTAVVRTFVPDDELTRGVTGSWLILLGVGVVLLVGTAVAGDRIAVRLSRSVLELSDVAERLGSGDLTARVEPSGPPEVASVGRVLNGLGARVAALLASEREMVADLSHRLRTPITALRLDVDALADPEERARMTTHVDELVAAVDAVVRSARCSGACSPLTAAAGSAWTSPTTGWTSACRRRRWARRWTCWSTTSSATPRTGRRSPCRRGAGPAAWCTWPWRTTARAWPTSGCSSAGAAARGRPGWGWTSPAARRTRRAVTWSWSRPRPAVHGSCWSSQRLNRTLSVTCRRPHLTGDTVVLDAMDASPRPEGRAP